MKKREIMKNLIKPIVPTAEYGYKQPKIVKKTIMDEIKTDMDEFFTEMDKVIYGPQMTPEEVKYWEMKAELHYEK